MAKKLNYLWRLFATAVSFFSFGLGGLLLWAVIFPVMALLPGSKTVKNRRAQRVVHYSFYVFIGLMHRLGVMTYETSGLESLNRPGQLIVANHPTLVDIVFLLSRIREASCIVKAKLWHNPFMRGSLINAGYISNQDPEALIAECVAYLKAGGSMVIFPEGTRSVTGQLYRFQRGAAAIALQANAIVTPVTITCHPGTLTKAEKWYQIPERRFHLTLRVGEDFVLDGYRSNGIKPLDIRHFNEFMQNYFTQQRELYTHHGK